MKNLFIIVDCSGSIVAGDTIKVGQINDLLQDLVGSLIDKKINLCQIVCYANEAKLYLDLAAKQSFHEIPISMFSGRSNLGKAYSYVKRSVDACHLDPKECIVALISDGEATDDYKAALNAMDQNNEMIRLALLIGKSKKVVENHSEQRDYIFTFSTDTTAKDDFITMINEIIS